MKKDILIAVVAIMCALIIGGSVIGVQMLQQSSIERQREADRVEDRRKEQEKVRLDTEKQDRIADCIYDADLSYWSYMKINGKESADGTVWAENAYWDRAEKTKQQDIKNCYERYR